MDDWKLRARVVVKLDKKRNMFVSSYCVRDVVFEVQDNIRIETVNAYFSVLFLEVSDER